MNSAICNEEVLATSMDASLPLLLTALKEAPEPLTLTKLKSLAKAANIKQDLSSALQLVGGIEWPPKTPKGTRRYWHKSPPTIDDAIGHCIASLERSAEPVGVDLLNKSLPKSDQMDKAWYPAIETALRERGLFEFPPSTSRGRPRFWTRSPENLLDERVRALLDARPYLLADLPKALKLRKTAATVAAVDEAVQRLEGDGRIFQDMIGGKLAYFSVVWARKSAPAPQTSGHPELPIRQAVESVQSGPGNYVPVYKLRLTSGSNAEFDRQAVALARQQKLVLIAYDGPRPVPDERKHEFIEDNQGRLFIGVACPRQ